MFLTLGSQSLYHFCMQWSHLQKNKKNLHFFVLNNINPVIQGHTISHSWANLIKPDPWPKPSLLHSLHIISTTSSKCQYYMLCYVNFSLCLFFHQSRNFNYLPLTTHAMYAILKIHFKNYLSQDKSCSKSTCNLKKSC